MNNNSITSIIIPTYNRVHLIGETLDSILAQTYANWECLVIDDGSTDTTDELLRTYCKQDIRFNYFKRPASRKKGANTCRNIGLENAIGDYIVFFDSDDLMTPDHLEQKYTHIQQGNFDFVISRTQFFNAENSDIDKNYTFDQYIISPENYVTQKINWLTLDVMIKASIAKSIKFNEKLQSGQEYNYFSKLVFRSCKAFYINKVLSLRRKHDESIRANLNSESKLMESYFLTKWNTYLDIKPMANLQTKVYLIKNCLDLVYRERKILTTDKRKFIGEVFSITGVKGIWFFPMLWSLKLFNRGYVFRKYLFNSLPNTH